MATVAGMARVAAIDVVDDPARWASCGFAVDGDGGCRVGTVRLRIGPAGTDRAGVAGAVGWSLADLPRPPTGGTVDGVATAAVDEPPAEPTDHPNGALGIDHVVVVTPDVDRTAEALQGLGLELRRIREGESMGRPVRQAFFRLGDVIAEVAGPPSPAADAAGTPASIWGLAFTVNDLDATARHLGERLGDPRPAVQPGRRIAGLRRSAGLGLPVAFLSPEQP